MTREMSTWREALVYHPDDKRANKMARRYYDLYRIEVGLPARCDIEDCRFYTEPLEWNGAPLKLRLDHVSGDYCDDRPKNLRLVCPNCAAQLNTDGGKNRGRVISRTGDDKRRLRRDDGGINHVFHVQPPDITFPAPSEPNEANE